MTPTFKKKKKKSNFHNKKHVSPFQVGTHVKNVGPQIGNSARDWLEFELRKMWCLINQSVHTLSWHLCDIFTCFRAPECWHCDYFLYTLDVLYYILFLVIMFLYIFARFCIHLFCMIVCCMTTFLLHDAWFAYLCGTHMHPLTLIHIAWSALPLYSTFWMYLRHFLVFFHFNCISSFDWIVLLCRE